MLFLSACYLQQGRNAASLVLQQYRCRHSQVFFGCVCVGAGENGAREGGYMAEQILQWFRGLPIKKLLKNREKAMDRLEEELGGTLRRIDAGLENSGMAAGGAETGFAGILCLEDSYLMLRRGAGGICLVNRVFGRVHIRRFGAGAAGGYYAEQGILQPDICLLCASEGFFGHVTEGMIADGLSAAEVETEKQMERHLRELAAEGGRRGGSDMAAVLMRTW